LSTKYIEFICIIEACKELQWVKKFLRELGFVQKKYLLFMDSQSVIHLGKNSTFHSRSNHIDVRYQWIQDALNVKLLELTKIHSDDNDFDDMMTKALPRCLVLVMKLPIWRSPPHSHKEEICWILCSFPIWKKGLNMLAQYICPQHKFI